MPRKAIPLSRAHFRHRRQTIQHDIDYFFTATAIYDKRHNIPWKRFVSFSWPPGNGKPMRSRLCSIGQASPALMSKVSSITI
jgi:hypothetical protein